MERFKDYVVNYAYATGVCVRSDETIQHIPMSLYPRQFPKSKFEQAKSLAQPYNILVSQLSRQPKLLLRLLDSTAEADEFTGNIVSILKHVTEKGIAQDLTLEITRSDYMVDQKTNALLQVELNTVAAGFAGLSAKIQHVHERALDRFNMLPGQPSSVYAPDTTIEPNNAYTRLAHGMHIAYVEQRARSATPHPGVVVFVVQPNERNIMDQRTLEFALWDNHHVPTVRLTLQDLHKVARLEPETNALLVDLPSLDAFHASAASNIGETAADSDAGADTTYTAEAAVVYFRAGYIPDDYPSETEWVTRRMLECSRAVKCPSVASHLVGAKKVQQALATPRVLEEVLAGSSELGGIVVDGHEAAIGTPEAIAHTAAELRRSFAGLWSLDAGDRSTADVQAAIDDALLHPENYVLKPQREGGGHNFYGADVAAKLRSFSPKELSAHILMQRIFPRELPAAFIREKQVVRGQALCELGVYGVYVGDGKRVLCNEYAGYLVRTKLSTVDEGGVAAGFSVLDSLVLVQD